MVFFFTIYNITCTSIYLKKMKCGILNIFNQQKNDVPVQVAVSIIDLFNACFILEYARQLNCLLSNR